MQATKLIFATCFVIVCLMTGCKGEPMPDSQSGKREDNPALKNEIEDEENQLIPVNLVGDFIRIWSDCSYSIEILQDGDFSVKSQNPDIVSVRISDAGKQSIVLTAGNIGKSLITITDNDNPERETAFTCYSTAFSNHWGQPAELLKVLPNDVIIIAKNRAHVADIEAELLKRAISHYAEKYEFKTDGKLIVINPLKPTKEHTGTFQWCRQTRELTLNYNGTNETYSVDVLPHGSGYAPVFITVLSQDYTVEYAAKYPDDVITKVILRRHIMSYTDRWWRDPSINDLSGVEICI